MSEKEHPVPVSEIIGATEQQASSTSACCSETKQSSCCEPSAKATCCSTDQPAGSCGCR